LIALLFTYISEYKIVYSVILLVYKGHVCRFSFTTRSYLQLQMDQNGPGYEWSH